MDLGGRIKYAQALISEDSEKAEILLSNSMPKHLYQYRSGLARNTESNELFDIENLRMNEIRMSKASSFNDPYDSLIFCNSKDIIYLNPNIKKECDITEDIINSVNEGFDYQELFYVSCFTEDFASMLMWSHYANRHMGFCVEYELQKLQQVAPTPFPSMIRPVIYDNEELNFMSLNFDQRISLYPYIKSSEWSYEKEWRLAIKAVKAEGYDYSTCNGLSIYIGKPTGIYMGTRIDKNNNDLIDSLFSYCKNDKVRLYRMKIDYENIMLKPILVN